MATARKIEVSTRFATTVDSMPEAFAFIMEHMEKPEAGDTPSIHIHPISVADFEANLQEPDAWKTIYEVVVDGMVERDKEPSHDHV